MCTCTYACTYVLEPLLFAVHAAVGNSHPVVEGDQVTDKVEVRLASGSASSQGTATYMVLIKHCTLVLFVKAESHNSSSYS